MPSQLSDLTDPRYLDEVGWFLHHERHGREKFGASYDAERKAYSQLLLDEVLPYAERDANWLADKSVTSVGCGCTGDLALFPAAVKIAIDPLLYVYQKLGLLMADWAGSATAFLSLDAEGLPLLDDFADLVICRNALDHMTNRKVALAEMRRTLKADGLLFASVDLGGAPTPDEPTVFALESLRALLGEHFTLLKLADHYRPHSERRDRSARIVAWKKLAVGPSLDKTRFFAPEPDETARPMAKHASSKRVVVLGIMGRTRLAGVIWQALHYLEGFRRLGLDVYYIEDAEAWPYDPERNTVTDDCAYAVKGIGEAMARFGFFRSLGVSVAGRALPRSFRFGS
jgi:SAM-dependent methyltransferase